MQAATAQYFRNCGGSAATFHSFQRIAMDVLHIWRQCPPKRKCMGHAMAQGRDKRDMAGF